MARFFLHVRDSQRIEDPEGGVYRDLATARQDAVTALREIVGERLRAGETLGEPAIEICDETGQMLDTVAFADAVRLR